MQLTNIQQELLKIFSTNIPDNQLIEIREMLKNYFAKKISEEADKVWEQKGYTDKITDDWVNDPNQ